MFLTARLPHSKVALACQQHANVLIYGWWAAGAIAQARIIGSMAENITQYKAGQALLVLLQQQELKPQVVQQITDVVAELLQEAGRVQESNSGLLICRL